MSSNIKPFKISVPDAAIERLKRKLADATYPAEVSFSDDWDYGAPLEDVKRLAARWQDGFDWRAAEARLNELPQYMTTIPVDGQEDVEMHFVHQKSSRQKSIPLVFVHGWPGSFVEVTKVLHLLTEPKDGSSPSFHVVAPSLPNFGFSSRTGKRGFGIPDYAQVCHRLMLQLGYDRYVTQGGDWGFHITRAMAVLYPSHTAATHINMVLTPSPPSPLSAPLLALRAGLTPHTAAERAGLQRTAWFDAHSRGYNLLQATRPHTVGFALADSPLGLLAWIYEKLRDWSDSYPWTDDEVLLWVSLYVFSRAGPDASVRIYYERDHDEARGEIMEKHMGYVAGVPLGLSYFPRDIVVPPATWGRALGPVVFEKRHEAGGHFAAWEQPELLVGDLRTMFGKGGGAEGVIVEGV